MRETVDQVDVCGEPDRDQLPVTEVVMSADAADISSPEVVLPDGIATDDTGTAIPSASHTEKSFGELNDDQGEPTPEPRRPELAPIPGSELQQSPHYQCLQREGAAGAALMPYLHRLGVTSNDYVHRTLVRGQGDEIDQGLIDRLGDADGAKDNYDVDQLTGILDASLAELKARPELTSGVTTNWLGLGTALLDRAAEQGEDADFSDKRTLFSSAAVAALMSENPDDRITFLEQAGERGLNEQMQRSLAQCDISVVMGGYRNADIRIVGGSRGLADRSVQRVRNFGSAFEADQETVHRYRQLVERNFGEYVDAHTAMKDVASTYDTVDGACHDGHSEVLEDASIDAPNVDAYRIDPTKAERFALEEVFVQAQMDALFPNGDTTQFQEELARMRVSGQNTETALIELISNTQTVITSMSAPVIERFYIPEGKPNDTWTREQLVAWRYQDLAKTGKQFDDIIKFVDPTIFGRVSNFSESVFGIAQNGAALPIAAPDTVHVAIALANRYTADTGDRVTPEELRELTQEKRRQIMKLAAINIDNLSASLVAGTVASATTFGRTPAVVGTTELYRHPSGKLDLKGPLFKTETSATQAAARLACVALRVQVDSQPAEAEVPTRKINSIELLSELVIDEAYARGIFKSGLAQAA